jgi:hypothetical protein
MLISQSLCPLVFLLFSNSASARVADVVEKRKSSPNRSLGLLELFRRLVNANGDVIQCNQDNIWTIMSSDMGKTACSELFSSPNATVTVSATSTQYVPIHFGNLEASLIRSDGQRTSLRQ